MTERSTTPRQVLLHAIEHMSISDPALTRDTLLAISICIRAVEFL